MSVPEHQVIAFISAIPALSQLNSLHLAGWPVTLSALPALQALLSRHRLPCLRSLRFQQCRFSAAALAELLQSLPDLWPRLRSLGFPGVEFAYLHVLLLQQNVLPRLTSCYALDLSDTGISADATARIVHALPRCDALRDLRVPETSIAPAFATACPRIHHCSLLSAIRAPSDVTIALTAVLPAWRHLRCIDATRWCLDPEEHAEAFPAAFAHPWPHLEILALPSAAPSSLLAAAASNLARCLHSVQHLTLTRIDPAPLFQALHTLPLLRDLHLDHCLLTSQSLAVMVNDALDTCVTLREFSVSLDFDDVVAWPGRAMQLARFLHGSYCRVPGPPDSCCVYQIPGQPMDPMLSGVPSLFSLVGQVALALESRTTRQWSRHVHGCLALPQLRRRLRVCAGCNRLVDVRDGLRVLQRRTGAESRVSPPHLSILVDTVLCRRPSCLPLWSSSPEYPSTARPVPPPAPVL